MMGFGERLLYAFRCFFAVLFKGEIPAEIARVLIKRPAPQQPAAAAPAAPAPQQPAAATRAAPAAPAPPPVAAPAAPAVRPEAPAAESFDRAVQMLALLQRDGRLVDFITEDIAPYQDAQIGAAARDVHESCRKVIEHYIELEPVIASEEGQQVTVEPGFDPAAIKLIGNVVGRPPLRGLLRHRGWRVARVNLPPLPAGKGRQIIAPAEVEIM